MTAIFIPSLLFRRCCRRVVFPLPKNPDKIVIGIFESSIDFSLISTVEENSLVTPSPRRENGWKHGMAEFVLLEWYTYRDGRTERRVLKREDIRGEKLLTPRKDKNTIVAAGSKRRELIIWYRQWDSETE